MKNQLLILLILSLSITLSSCKKDDNSNTTPTNQLFIAFTLDGISKNYTGTNNQINTGGGGYAYTSSGFFDLTKDISISLSMPQDTILGSDLQSLIGQKIPIGSCGGCPTNIEMSYDIGGNSYDSFDSNNPYPANYIKFNTVTFSNTISLFGQSLNLYFVTGEFNLKLSFGSDIKNATNGTFRLVFQEVKN